MRGNVRFSSQRNCAEAELAAFLTAAALSDLTQSLCLWHWAANVEATWLQQYAELLPNCIIYDCKQVHTSNWGSRSHLQWFLALRQKILAMAFVSQDR